MWRAGLDIAARLLAAGRAPATPTAVVSRGTLPDQRVVGSALADIAQAAEDADVRGPAVLIVGDVVRLSERIAWFGADRAAAPPVR